MKKIISKIVNYFGYDFVYHSPDQLDTFRHDKLITIDINQLMYSKIHYGCGSRLKENWINVDWLDADLFPGVENYTYFKMNLVERQPFPDNIFEFGYAEDFLEHLTQADSIVFLSEAYRTLKPEGILRLSFPGLEGVLSHYYKNTSYYEIIKGKRDAYTTHGHVHFYSREELSGVCSHIGFRGITFFEHGKSLHKELCNIDTREEQRDLNTYAEITK